MILYLSADDGNNHKKKGGGTDRQKNQLSPSVVLRFNFLSHNNTSTAAAATLLINCSLVTYFRAWQQTAAPMGHMISGFSRWPQQIEVWLLRPDFKSIKHYYFVPHAPSPTLTSEHRKGNK